jgi:hypothetical protein
MSSRSIAVCAMLTFTCVGLLGGCGDDAKDPNPGKDAGPDGPLGGKDAAGVPDALPADVEPGKKDAPGEDAQPVRADAAADITEGRDTAVKKDLPSPIGSPVDTGPDGETHDATPASEVGKPGDAPAVADSKPRVDSDLTPFCQGILLDSRPDTYPVLYREPASAEELFATRTGALLSAYGLDDADYTFEPAPITWATTVKQGMGPCTLALGGTVTKETVTAMAQSFLTKWGDIFQYQDNGKVDRVGPSCFNKFCQARLQQDYCGLPVFSEEMSYRGAATFYVYASDGCLNEATSSFVPMVPMPRNVLLSEAEIERALLGLELSYSCPGGKRTVQVSEQDAFTMPDTPSVLVRKSATEANAVEYRLAVPVEVEIGGSMGLPWIIYVDGIDGTVLANVAEFICG